MGRAKRKVLDLILGASNIAVRRKIGGMLVGTQPIYSVAAVCLPEETSESRQVASAIRMP